MRLRTLLLAGTIFAGSALGAGYAQRVTSIAQLQSYNAATMAQVGSFSVDGTSLSGGSSPYIWRPTSVSASSTPNGITIIKPADDASCAQHGCVVAQAPVVTLDMVGGVGDAIQFNDGTISGGSNSFSSAATTFTSADIGKGITIPGAGAASAQLVTTITGITSAHVITLAATASSPVSGVQGWYGTDNAAALTSMVTAASGGIAVLPSAGLYFTSAGFTLDVNTNLINLGASTIVCASTTTCFTTLQGSGSKGIQITGLRIFVANTTATCIDLHGSTIGLVQWTISNPFCYAVPWSSGLAMKLADTNTGVINAPHFRNFSTLFQALPSAGGVNSVHVFGGEFSQDTIAAMPNTPCVISIDGGIGIDFTGLHMDNHNGARPFCIATNTLAHGMQPPINDGMIDSVIEGVAANAVPSLSIGTGTLADSTVWPQAVKWVRNFITHGTTVGTPLLDVHKTSGCSIDQLTWPGDLAGLAFAFDVDTSGCKVTYGNARPTSYTDLGTGNMVMGHGVVEQAIWDTGLQTCSITLRGSTSGSNTANFCRYSQINHVVHLQFRFTGAINAMVGNYSIGNLPVKTSSVANLFGGGYFYYFTPSPGAGTTQDKFRMQLDVNALTGTVVDVATGSAINSANITGTYDVAGTLDYQY